MLKALVQLFAEKFLKNQSEWVGQQAFPSRRINISLTLTQYVPPSDGFLGFYKPIDNVDKTIDIYAYSTGGGIVSRSTFSTSSENVYTISGTIPVKKGYSVVISGTFAELWFSPAVGSKY
jgi:hypothetical protein